MTRLRRLLALCLAAAVALAGLGRLPAAAASDGPTAIEIAGVAISLCLDGAVDKSARHADCDHCTLRGAAALPPPPVAAARPPERCIEQAFAPVIRRAGGRRVLEASFARGPPLPA